MNPNFPGGIPAKLLSVKRPPSVLPQPKMVPDAKSKALNQMKTAQSNFPGGIPPKLISTKAPKMPLATPMQVRNV